MFFFVLLFFIGIIFVIANQSYANKTFENNTTKILEDIKNETYKKYNIGTYNISSNEISIEIIGESEYYNSVKNEIENIIKKVIKSTEFESYSIRVYQSKIDQIISEEEKEEVIFLEEVYANLNSILTKSYPKLFVRLTINTSIQDITVKVETSSNQKQKLTNIEKEMETEIYDFLKKNSKGFMEGKPIKIYIYNKHGKKLIK